MLLFFHFLRAIEHDQALLANLRQFADDDLIAFPKPVYRVWKPNFFAEVNHKRLCAPQIVPGQSGEQMVDRLELQTAMEEIKPIGTIHVHSRSELSRGETLTDAQVRRGHGKMRECNLYVHKHGGHVTHHDVHKFVPAPFDTPHQQVKKPKEEK